MPDPEVAGVVREQALDGVPDGEGRGLAAERVEGLDLVVVPAVAGHGDDEPAVGQTVQVRRPGARTARSSVSSTLS
ncbi:hypothetical protein ACFVRB_39140 [Streptomyces nojiriensis]|uniref:hypothetical protein n=1 Tax=Streptomyces nojiriensis TaxID=66374 RepID=UPI0036DCE610